MKSAELKAQREKMAQQRAWIDAGQCKECGAMPLATNLSGETSKFCVTHYEEFVGRYKRRPDQVTPPSRIDPMWGTMEISVVDRWDYKQAKPKIAAFIQDEQTTTVGAIRRRFEEYDHLIWDVLSALKAENLCDYCEWSAAPTRVTFEKPKRITPVFVPERWSDTPTILGTPDRSINPWHESVYGAENARVI